MPVRVLLVDPVVKSRGGMAKALREADCDVSPCDSLAEVEASLAKNLHAADAVVLKVEDGFEHDRGRMAKVTMPYQAVIPVVGFSHGPVDAGTRSRVLTSGVFEIIHGKGRARVSVEQRTARAVVRLSGTAAIIRATIESEAWARRRANAPADVGFCIIDNDFRVWYSDAVHRDLVGGPAAIGLRCWKAFHHCQAQRQPCIDCAVSCSLSTGKAASARHILCWTGKGLRYFETSARPIQYENAIVAAVEEARDVTGTPEIESLPEEKCFRMILSAIASRGYRQARIYYATPDGTVLTGAAAAGFPKGRKFEGLTLPTIGDRYCENTVLVKRHPVCYTGTEFGREPFRGKLGKKDVAWWLEYPFYAEDGNCLGLLAVDYKRGYPSRWGTKPNPAEVLMDFYPYARETQTILERKHYEQKCERLLDDLKKGPLTRIRDMGYQRIRLWHIERDDPQMVTCRLAIGRHRPDLRKKQFPLFDMVYGYEGCVVAREPRLYTGLEYEHDPVCEALGRAPGEKWLQFPLYRCGIPIGVLAVDSPGKGELDRFDLERVARMAQENVEQLLSEYVDAREKIERIRRMRDRRSLPSFASPVARDEEATLQTCLDRLAKQIGATYGYIRVKRGFMLELGPVHGTERGDLRRIVYLGSGSSFSCEVASTASPRVFNHCRTTQEFLLHTKRARQSSGRYKDIPKLRAVGIFPLTIGGEVQGTLVLASHEDPEFFTPEHLRWIHLYENDMALAIRDTKIAREAYANASKTAAEDLARLAHHELADKKMELELQLRAVRRCITEPKPSRSDLSAVCQILDVMETRLAEIPSTPQETFRLYVEGVSPRGRSDINKVAREFLDPLSSSGRAFQVSYESSAASVRAAIPEEVLMRVLRQFLRNSMRVRRRGLAVTIETGYSAVAALPERKIPGPWAFLRFIDNGPGIPPAMKERVFRPGFSSRGGKGIGLPAIRRLLREYGAHVCETGQYREGADFRVYIPLKQAPEQTQPSAQAAETAKLMERPDYWVYIPP